MINWSMLNPLLIEENEDDIENCPNYDADYEGGAITMNEDYTPAAATKGGDDDFKKVKKDKKKKKKKDKKIHNIGSKMDEDEPEFAERVLPKGTPGRKSFNVIPKKKKKFWRPEAKALRKMFPIMGVFHFLFLISDIFIFGEILMIIVDSVLFWFDFYNYMVMNKICIAIQCFITLLIPLIALTHIQRGLQAAETTKLQMLIFIFQMFICYPLFLVLTGKRLGAHYQQQLDWKIKQK